MTPSNMRVCSPRSPGRHCQAITCCSQAWLSRTMGTVDEEALARFEIVDEQLAKVWEQKLMSLPGVQQAVVLIEPRTPKPKPLHTSALLPNTGLFTTQERKQTFSLTSETSR